jgi:ABC-type uncharacterized transport system involved in gliding motility auxiliary subunit
MISRERIVQAVGFFALALLALGAALYAINSAYRVLTNALLVGGATAFLVYVGSNLRVIGAFFRKRSSRYGANMIAMIIMFSTIIVIIQAVSVRHSYRYDLTRNKRFSLAGQTSNVLRGLDKDIELYGFFRQADAERSRATDLFAQYTHHSGRIRSELIDPDRKPGRAATMGVTDYGTVVIQCGNKREQVGRLSEEALTNAILKVTRDVVKVVYFVVGHGEKDPTSSGPAGYSIMRDAVESENYDVKTLSLFDEPAVPEDCHLVIVAGPTNDYFESETTKITEYLSSGRNALFLADPRVSLPNIEKVLAQYRVILEDNVIIDPYSRIFGAEYTVPVVTQYVEHPITREIDVATFYPMSRSVRLAPPGDQGVVAQYLAQTGKSAWGETDLDGVRRGQAVRDEADAAAPLAIAIIASKKYEDGAPSATGSDESKIVVFGDSDFADNSAFRISGNADLLLNAINFLAEEKELLAIRPKEGLGDRLFLTASEGRFIFLVSVVLLPLSVIGLGTSVFVKRRRAA